MNNPLVSFSVYGGIAIIIAVAIVVIISYLHEKGGEYRRDWKKNEILKTTEPIRALECSKPGVIYDEYHDFWRRFDDQMADALPGYRRALKEEIARHERVQKEVAGSSDTALYMLADLWDVLRKEEANV